MFQIRKADSGDCNAILACLRAAFEKYRTQYTSEGFADTVLDSETVQQRMREMFILVAVSEGVIIGTIAFATRGEEGHLRGMAVLPDWQGTGAASALLRAAENELQRTGCSLVTLDATEPLTRATRFYVRHGFSKSGRTSDFFGMPLYEYAKRLPLPPQPEH
jgi:predicted N-acetyltransferase YhbS